MWCLLTRMLITRLWLDIQVVDSRQGDQETKCLVQPLRLNSQVLSSQMDSTCLSAKNARGCRADPALCVSVGVSK